MGGWGAGVEELSERQLSAGGGASSALPHVPPIGSLAVGGGETGHAR